MELLRYMLTNIRKRPVRTAFIVAAGALSSVVLVFAFALGTRVSTHVRADTIAKWTGHLWVSAASDFEFKEAEVPAYEREARAVRDYLARDPAVVAAVPWIPGYCEMQAGTAREYVQISATDFELDAPFRENTELVSGAFPGPGEEYGLVVTSSIAAKHALKVGDSITLFISSAFGARNAMDFVITGISRASAPWYESMVAMRAADYLSMTEMTDFSPFYKAYVKDEKAIPRIVKELSALAPDFKVKGYRDDEFVRFILSLGQSDIALFGVMAAIIFLALLIGINSIVMTNIFDRRDEIGTLRALGFSRNVVRNLFFGESVLSLFIGYLAGAGLVAALGAWFDSTIVRPPLLMLQYMFGMTRMSLAFTPATALLPFAFLFLLLFLSSYRRIGLEAEKQAVSQMASR